MPMFENARDFSLYNSTFIDQGSTVDPLKALTDRVAWGAMHDSADRYDPPRCHPQTRTAILDRINSWASGTTLERPILWLNGPAGAGKSAIAQTLAERWSQAGILGGSFFMQRTAAGRNNKESVIPTLAYQFALQSEHIRSYVKTLLLADSQVCERSLSSQLNALIGDSVVASHREDRDERPSIFVIDGLDECCDPYNSQTHEEQQKEILEAVASISCRNLPLRFLIASRPEAQIRQSFFTDGLREMIEQVTLVGSPQANGDIAMFLHCKFAEIRSEHRFIDRSWPSGQAIEKVLRNSSGNFAYPSTVVRHLSSPRVNPEQALDAILYPEKTDGPWPSRMTKARPLAPLDDFYMYILQSAIPHLQSRPFAILQLLLSDEVEIERFKTISGLAELWSTTPQQIDTDLADLHSLLSVPHHPDSALYFHHQSFSEFLTDSRRSERFWAGGPCPLPLQIALLEYSRRNLHKNRILRIYACDRSLTDSPPQFLTTQGRTTLSRCLRLLLHVAWMTNSQEVLERPIPWLRYSFWRNIKVLEIYLYILGRFCATSLILKPDWDCAESLYTFTLPTIRVLFPIHTVVEALRLPLSLTSSLFTSVPGISLWAVELLSLLTNGSTFITRMYGIEAKHVQNHVNNSGNMQKLERRVDATYARDRVICHACRVSPPCANPVTLPTLEAARSDLRILPDVIQATHGSSHLKQCTAVFTPYGRQITLQKSSHRALNPSLSFPDNPITRFLMALLQTSSYNPFAALREPLMPVIPPVLNAVAGPSRAAVRTPVELGANCFSNASSVGFDGPTSLTNAGQNVYNFHHSTITSGSLAGPTPPAVPAGANSSPAPYSDQQQISQDSSTHNRGTVTLSGSRQHPSSTYSRLQNEHALGYALYRPQPISSLPAPCREKGVCIGDVGLVTPDGGFDPCFNIYLPAEDPVNIGRTPPNFQPMYPSRMPFEDIDEDHDAWQAGDAKYAGSVSRQQPPSSFSRRSGALFEGSATEGAVLVLPRGGSSYNLRSTNDVFQYIEQHAEEWYDHINKPRSRGGLGRNAINGSLYAITGVDKTTSWGTGAFSGVKGEGKFPLHFRPANREDPSEMRFTHVWDQSGVATTRHGPSCEPLDDTSSRPENQCIFLRGFKVRLSKQSWKSIFSKKTKLQITPIMGPRSDGMSTSKGHHPFSASSRSSRVRAFMQGQSHRSQSSDSESSDDETHIISSIEPPIQQIHPSDAINCYLLEKHPQARLSITHDDTWCAVVAKDGKDALLLPNLLQRVSESNVVHHSHGTVRFGQPDARSAENQIGSSWTQESASETSRASVSPPETPRATYDRLLSSFPSCDFSRVPSTGLTPVHHATFPYYQARITYVTRDYAPEQEDKKAKAHGCRREALLEDIRQQARSIRQSMDELNGRTPRQSWSHYCRDERGYLAARTELDPETMLNQQLDDMSSDRRRPQRDSGESQKYLVDFRSLILDAAPSLSLNTIRGITPDNRAPVYSGGFDDVFRGEWGGKYIFMKAPRLYTASHLNEDVGITDYHQMTEKRPHVPEVWFPGCHPDVGGSYTKNTTRGHADSPLRWTTRECYQIILNSECSRGHAIGIPPENFDKTQLGNDVNATFHPFSWWEQLVRESRLLLMPTHRPSVCDDSLLHLDTSTRMAWSTANGPPHHPLALLHPTALGRPYNHILPPQSESSDTIDNVKAKIHGEDGVSSSEWHLRCRLIPMRPSDLIINSFLGIESSHSQERVDDQECTNSDGCRFED